jgi:hypothetical protein
MNDWMNWLAQCLKNEFNCGFHTQNSWHRVYLSVCNTLNQITVTFRYSDAVGFIYSCTEIQFCHLFHHPQNWRYSSASQHEIPVFSTNLIVHFQTFEIFISRLTSALAFAIIFESISKNKRHKTQLRYYSAYDCRYEKTEFLTLDRATCLELFPVKLTVRTLRAVGNFSGRQTERQTPPVARNYVRNLSDCLEI